MTELVSKYDITPRELNRGKRLAVAAVSAPILLSTIPAVVFSILFFVFGSAPPVAVTLAFFGFLSTVIGLAIGLIFSGYFLYKRSNWTRELRERMAADGIKASELEWFMHELKSNERRALKQIESRDLLLGDAYRETLASRLTATRITKSSRRELSLMERRKNKLKQLGAGRSAEFISEVERDVEKLKKINTESQQMLVEAEARLQMLEAASIRGGGITDSEIALDRLGARARELPLALEEAKMAESIRKELEEGSDSNFEEDLVDKGNQTADSKA